MSTTREQPDVTLEASPEYRAARERAEQVQGVLIHLLVYTVVNAGLVIIDALAGDGWWFFWPLMGWGIGLLLHVVVVFLPVFGTDWVDRRARRAMESGQRR